jgi:protein TonB
MDVSVSLIRPVLRARDRMAGPDRRGRLPATEGGVSLGLHLLILALLLVGVARHRLHDTSEPGTVAVVLEGGPRSSARQTEESRMSHPTMAPNPAETESQPVGTSDSRPATRARAAPATKEVQPSRQVPTPVPPAFPEAPEAPAGTTSLTVPMPSPRGERAPHPVVRPRPARMPERAMPAKPLATLANPMSFSLQGHPPPPASEGHLKRGINLAMAPNDQNSNIMTRYAEARHRLGEDWWSAFTQYVEDHKYYPLSAAERGEDGQSVLHLVIARDGTVLSVKIERSSGSVRLDDAWISEFRGAKVPAFPPGTTEDEITFSASMDYILLHE